jgi:hypothetical protein
VVWKPATTGTSTTAITPVKYQQQQLWQQQSTHANNTKDICKGWETVNSRDASNSKQGLQKLPGIPAKQQQELYQQQALIAEITKFRTRPPASPKESFTSVVVIPVYLLSKLGKQCIF